MCGLSGGHRGGPRGRPRVADLEWHPHFVPSGKENNFILSSIERQFCCTLFQFIVTKGTIPVDICIPSFLANG